MARALTRSRAPERQGKGMDEKEREEMLERAEKLNRQSAYIVAIAAIVTVISLLAPYIK